MTRRSWISAALALAGCGEKAELPPNLFPPSMAGGWNLVEARNMGASESPDPVPRNSVERLRAATYKLADGEINAHVYLLNSAAVGAALASRWRPSPDTVFFNHGQYFVVVKWQAAGRKPLHDFVAELQQRLGANGVSSK